MTSFAPLQHQSAKALESVSVCVVVARQQGLQSLSAMEVRLVRYLEGHAGRYVDGWELKDHLYGGIASDAAIRFLVNRVRFKLGKHVIETGDFGGYRINHGQAMELDRVCVHCRKPVVRYQDEWVCYGCPSTQAADLDVGRSPAHGMNGGKQWNETERAFAIAHAQDMSHAEIGEALQRSESSVRGELTKLGIKKRYVRRR